MMSVWFVIQAPKNKMVDLIKHLEFYIITKYYYEDVCKDDKNNGKFKK